MIPPIGRQSHFTEGDFRVLVKKGKQPVLPSGGGADFAKPVMADAKRVTNPVWRKSWLAMPLRVLVLAVGHPWGGSTNPVPDTGVMSAGIP